MPSILRLTALTTFILLVHITLNHFHPRKIIPHVLVLSNRKVLLTEEFLEPTQMKRNIFTPEMLATPFHDFSSRESGAIVAESSNDCYNAGGMLEHDMDRLVITLIP